MAEAYGRFDRQLAGNTRAGRHESAYRSCRLRHRQGTSARAVFARPSRRVQTWNTFEQATTILMAGLFIFVMGAFALAIGVLFVIDVTQTRHATRRDFPVFGRFRYWFEHLGILPSVLLHARSRRDALQSSPPLLRVPSSKGSGRYRWLCAIRAAPEGPPGPFSSLRASRNAVE